MPSFAGRHFVSVDVLTENAPNLNIYGDPIRKLTINHQVHCGFQVLTSYICVYGTFVTAGVFRSHAEERQTVFLPKLNLGRGAVYVRLVAASTFHDHPLFSVLVEL